ncbi:MAG: 50S ribosomal protein L33 [Candidatus Doudnabacteria bacterium CG10_big_fil_rev_8_21_14_0_10_41_10]|uniref:Large ribosomal subunit protein bL33 n=1 Tax=Candidatus Doudnabacteria bacterium CG10_big_fil_rev_8_21_14_0_10_41_10 TaxID=1974551 RepID=A0A2H0VEI0_9BACT|nr:MAG: 50S ribosomal protein L33 [Candidatus Doudnabacteria bacterium CG10_big_fil_rev_8_21_14_0_10_41_10]
MSQKHLVKLVCTECKRSNYYSNRNPKSVKEKLALKKFCKKCRKRTDHKESKVKSS